MGEGVKSKRKYLASVDNAAAEATAKVVRKHARTTKREVAKAVDIRETAINLVDKIVARDSQEPDVYVERIQDLVKSGPQYISKTELFEAFRHFEKAVGGREKLIVTLRHCPQNSLGYAMMLKLLDDPAFIKASAKNGEDDTTAFALATVCKRQKIPLNVLIAAFRDAKSAQLAVESLIAVGHHAPTVVSQMAEDAQNRWVPCTTCRGTARVKRLNDVGEFMLNRDGEFETQLCFACRGEGMVWAKHDFQNRQKFLEFTGILKKEPLVQNNNTIDNRHVSIGASTPGDGTFEGVMKSLDALVRKPKTIEADVIDAEVVAAPLDPAQDASEDV